MITRPYPEKSGRRVWLSREESRQLLEEVEDSPRRRIAIQLGLSGLRTDEIVRAKTSHIREIGGETHLLEIPDGKTGARETPISRDLADRMGMLKSAARIRKDEPLVDVSKRQVRNWISNATESLEERSDNGSWRLVGMHDLRRTWSTDSYYSLAFRGVPIAEQLVMSWGGWAQTETGRSTWRQNYLGPIPDHISRDAIQEINLV